MPCQKATCVIWEPLPFVAAYVWILSRNPILNEVSKELAIKQLAQINVNEPMLVKEDRSKCVPKYFEDVPVEPTTFRYPVPI